MENKLEEYKTELMRLVIKHTGVDISTYESQHSKKQEHVWARQTYWKLARIKIPNKLATLEHLGKLEHRDYDHTTVIHGTKQVDIFATMYGDPQGEVYKKLLGVVPPFIDGSIAGFVTRDKIVKSLENGRIGTVVKTTAEEALVLFEFENRQNDFVKWIAKDSLEPNYESQ